MSEVLNVTVRPVVIDVSVKESGPTGPAGVVQSLVAGTGITVGGTAAAPSVTLNTASNTETLAGTDTAKAVTPGGLANSQPFAVIDNTSTPADISARSLALSAVGGGTINLKPGVYAINAPLNLHDGVRLEGGPGVIFEIGVSSPNYPMLIEGVEGAQTALTADLTAGSYSVTLPTGAGATFAVDDVIGFISPAIVSGGDGRTRELHQVLGVSGDTITLDAPLRFPYTTTDAAKFFKTTPKKDIVISGITLRWPTNPIKQRGPIFKKVIRCHFRDITVVNGPGITLGDAISCSATNTVVDGSKEYNTIYLPGSYGVTVSGSGHGVVVNGGTFRATRHCVTTLYHEVAGPLYYTGPFDTIFSDLVGWGGPESFATFDTHAHAQDTLFSNCKSIGGAGFQDRGVRTQILGCSARDSNRGIALTTAAVDPTVADCVITNMTPGGTPTGITAFATGTVIRDCRFTNCSTGINNNSNALIEGCTFEGTYLYGIQEAAASDLGQIARNCTFRMSSFGILGYRGLVDNPIFTGVAGIPFYTTTNTRMTKPISPPTTVAYAATMTPEPTRTNCISITLTGNITIANPNANNTVKGCTFRVMLTQDATGGRTITFGSAYRASWTPDITAGKINVIEFQYDGTSWVQTSAAVGL